MGSMVLNPKPDSPRQLVEVCENAQKPSGFLMVKIGELEILGRSRAPPIAAVLFLRPPASLNPTTVPVVAALRKG